MKVFTVLALTLIGTKANLPGDYDIHPMCPGRVIGKKCVTSSRQKMTHADAAQSCDADNGGNIFEIRTQAMYDALAKLASASKLKLWVGAKKTAEGDWRWLSDNSSEYIPEKWFQCGEPNNWRGNEECLQMQPNGKLNDAHCDKTFEFYCFM